MVQFELDVSEPVTSQERALDVVLERESIIQEYKRLFPNKRPISIHGDEQVESKHFIAWKSEALSKEYDEVQEIDSKLNEFLHQNSKPLDLQEIDAKTLNMDDLQKQQAIDLEISAAIQERLAMSKIQFNELVETIKENYGGLVSIRGAYLLICKTHGLIFEEEIIEGLDVSKEQDEIMVAKEAIVMNENKDQKIDNFAWFIKKNTLLDFMWKFMNTKMMINPEKPPATPSELKVLQKVKEVLGK